MKKYLQYSATYFGGGGVRVSRHLPRPKYLCQVIIWFYDIEIFLLPGFGAYTDNHNSKLANVATPYLIKFVHKAYEKALLKYCLNLIIT